MRQFRYGFVLIILLAILAGCQNEAEVSVDPVAEIEAEVTSQPTVPRSTATAQPTATPLDTATPSFTMEPTTTPPSPTATLEPNPTPTIAEVTDCEPTRPDAQGPFYVPNAPERDVIGQGHVLRGVVRSGSDCSPLAGAQIEFWLAGPDGEYSDAYRAMMLTDGQGVYVFESNLPPPYSGRPPHIHLRVSAEGHQTLVTQYYPDPGQSEGTFDLVLIANPEGAAETSPESEPMVEEAGVDQASPTGTSESEDTRLKPEPTGEEADSQTMAKVPLPSLFDIPWQDRSIFRDGLIASEQDILDDLLGASVYHIDLEIDDDLLNVTGQQEVLYTNREGVPLNEVYFRLFPNLADGSTIISSLTVNDQAVEPTLELQNSAMRVPLSSPLQPGEQIVIRMDFAVRVPDGEGGNYGTFAFVSDVLALAHFYPMIAVYDDEGWNVEVAPNIGDVVYADASFYLVRVTAPANQVVVASGIEIEHEETAEQQVVTITAGPMRDFYLATSSRYTVVSQTVGETMVNSFAPAELAAGAETALSQAVNAFESFNERYGTYPFTEFDLITTTTFALGIEYPGIVAILIDLYNPDAQIAGTPANILLESVVAHEVAHQWFYGLVGNDQLDDPWLDEALAQFLTIVYYSDVYGPNGSRGFRNSLQRRWGRVDGADIPIGLPVRDYTPEEYGAIVYGRGPLFIEALSQAMGPETFAEFIRDYYQTYKWDIATGEGFKMLAEQHCSCDLMPLFEEWVYGEKE